jgi:23S rRNA pseudouridine1911/1915/1917 synthase
LPGSIPPRALKRIMSQVPFPILYEDNHLLVINKPARLATMGVKPPRPSAIELAREYVKEKYDKPGNVYLGVVSRLDAPATGILIFARTSKAASRLTAAYRNREVKKIYQILVKGEISEPTGRLEDWVRKDERHRRMHITQPQNAGAKLARCAYRVLRSCGPATLVEVELETGRKHQIRLQFGSRGHPVLGDRKYGGTLPFASGIALHAGRLALIHPVSQKPLEFTTLPPAAWHAYGVPAE